MTSYTVADDRPGRSLPSRDFPLEVRALFISLHNDPPKLVAGLQALAADRGESPESTLETVANLYRDDPKFCERAPITEELESALGIRLSRTIAEAQPGDHHNTEPPERERPPIDSSIYEREYGAEQDQGTVEAPGDTWPRLELEDKPPHIGTDQANGYLIASQVGRDLLYVIRIGWHAWTGTHWRLGEEFAYRKAQRLSRLILDEVAAAAWEAANTEDAGKRKELMNISESLTAWAKKSESRDRVYSAMALAKPMLAIEHTELDQDHWLLNCTNGTLNLRTGTLRPPRRADFITRCIPVAYDPEATCPTWLKFLDRIFAGAADVIHFVQKALGYSLTADTSEQCVFFLWGSGQNGKSTLLSIVQVMMGAYAQQAAPDLLVVSKHERHTTDIAELRGARLVASIETGDGRRLNEPLIKQMSGEDRMKGHFMRQDNIEFDPTHKVFLATNHKPRIRGTDYAIWRRIRLIPFTVTIPPEERDPKLVEKLKAELPGILTWCVQGCLAWQQEGLEPPKEVTEATDQYKAESDVLAAFLADYCVIDRNAKVPKSELYETYKEWCTRTGEYAETQRRFSERMQEHGFQEYKTTGGLRTWQGVGLNGESGASGASGAEFGITNSKNASRSVYTENSATNATNATNLADADDFGVL